MNRLSLFEAMRFEASLDSYMAIIEWMKAEGDTNALANEVRFSTPLLVWPSFNGWHAAYPGDWILHDKSTGKFWPVTPRDHQRRSTTRNAEPIDLSWMNAEKAGE